MLLCSFVKGFEFWGIKKNGFVPIHFLVDPSFVQQVMDTNIETGQWEL